MNTLTTKPTVLLVDDEERILRSLSMLFRLQFKIHATTNPQQAIAIARSEPVHVVVSDQRMPQMLGADLLREIRAVSPNSMRLLLTGYSEYEAVVASINEGEVFRFIAKPWDAVELRSSVLQAAEIAMNLSEQAAVEPARAMTAAPAGVLVIDTDPATEQSVREIVGASRPVYGATSLDEGFECLARHDVAVLISELFVNGDALTGALQMLKAQHPEVVTLVLTSFRDVSTLVGLINGAQVYRFLPKPLRKGPLSMSLQSALNHRQTLHAQPRLAQRHAVQITPGEGDPSIARKVMSYLSRLRARGLGSS
ncbi:response regulator [Algiphilus sp. W345]|uniref:Response regulator n=1 Tax=Banduia mediterranea TaxID=3075609 RepID=A0ABU2WI40_9GAMM|nr:response regulator [Algiphilus sp. W345]MDT0497539.1 response regulator [Algiphilus sp. W345]